MMVLSPRHRPAPSRAAPVAKLTSRGRAPSPGGSIASKRQIDSILANLRDHFVREEAANVGHQKVLRGAVVEAVVGYQTVLSAVALRESLEARAKAANLKRPKEGVDVLRVILQLVCKDRRQASWIFQAIRPLVENLDLSTEEMCDLVMQHGMKAADFLAGLRGNKPPNDELEYPASDEGVDATEPVSGFPDDDQRSETEIDRVVVPCNQVSAPPMSIDKSPLNTAYLMLFIKRDRVKPGETILLHIDEISDQGHDYQEVNCHWEHNFL